MAVSQQNDRRRKLPETPGLNGKFKKNRKSLRFVVQRHEATHLHYDLRLELGGVLLSWAVPKGPSMKTSDKRLAVQVENHPLDYIDFEGVIAKGNYGAGRVSIWDHGIFMPVDGKQKPISEKEAIENISEGEIRFVLYGKKLKGGFVLVRLKDEKNWLLIKHKDALAADESKNSENLVRTDHKNNSDDAESEMNLKIGAFYVKLTNINKIFWPGEEITKGQMLQYYQKIAPVILPYLKNRPLSLNRMPNGIMGKGFYHKDAGEHVPSFVATEKVHSASSDKTIDYIVCNNAATLLYVANLGSIEMNPWNSTRRKPDHPTYIIIDLDPSEGNSFDQVIDAALAVSGILKRAGATYAIKTSGATGLHIYIPLAAKYEYEAAKDFAHIIATLSHEQVPQFTTMERMLKKRGDRIYIDYLQNSKGQTLASAYSVRPVPGAQVSAPITESELNYKLRPNQFNIFNMEKRIRTLGDLFQVVLGKGNNIRSCLRNLGQ